MSSRRGCRPSGGADTYWTGEGRHNASIPYLRRTPDANGDGLPDPWAVRSDGSVRFHAGDRTSLPGSGTEVIAPTTWWKTPLAVG
ncbi:hypothetical protein ACFW6E_05575 [Streptomyces olivaceoviridis]|uniref:hypothetical protein n=1 Tax=Streptomyces olivaceoviridis TaxID=1921 RepID=UPI0036843E78